MTTRTSQANRRRTTSVVTAGVALALALAFGGATAASAQDIDGDLRIGLYSDVSELYVGGGLLTHMTGRWFFNPNVEYVFVDNGDLWTINADFHYDLARQREADFWLGGGPALVFRENRFGNDETDFGVNLLGGVSFLRDRYFRPYFQAKLLISDDTEGVITFGLRFD